MQSGLSVIPHLPIAHKEGWQRPDTSSNEARDSQAQTAILKWLNPLMVGAVGKPYDDRIAKDDSGELAKALNIGGAYFLNTMVKRGRILDIIFKVPRGDTKKHGRNDHD